MNDIFFCLFVCVQIPGSIPENSQAQDGSSEDVPSSPKENIDSPKKEKQNEDKSKSKSMQSSHACFATNSIVPMHRAENTHQKTFVIYTLPK